jgi:hypothetical protein
LRDTRATKVSAPGSSVDGSSVERTARNVGGQQQPAFQRARLQGFLADQVIEEAQHLRSRRADIAIEFHLGHEPLHHRKTQRIAANDSADRGVDVAIVAIQADNGAARGFDLSSGDRWPDKPGKDRIELRAGKCGHAIDRDARDGEGLAGFGRRDWRQCRRRRQAGRDLELLRRNDAWQRRAERHAGRHARRRRLRMHGRRPCRQNRQPSQTDRRRNEMSASLATERHASPNGLTGLALSVNSQMLASDQVTQPIWLSPR